MAPALGTVGYKTSPPPRCTNQSLSAFQPDAAAHSSILAGPTIFAGPPALGVRVRAMLTGLPAATVTVWVASLCAGALALKTYWPSSSSIDGPFTSWTLLSGVR